MEVGRKSFRVTCPNCKLEVKTETRAETTLTTLATTILMCIFCCWICIPFVYCTDCAKDIEHTCPLCKRHIGTNEW
ncbi:lipopolysaccharide-induced tumor necrosis factor-alpha factor homolog [Drosophila albomicans]|uniref:Lipopolysaccharide-induced tumor necrosis factor-alpha factor homolog n=1 Tax=Drosophila albomicans TaxID=7291 RepID=A0A9C6WBM1_DROAB|nr:lipopolysaccharide-induced tumor necrosis factor-alpha factor homolog [Drosophila albomicans]